MLAKRVEAHRRKRRWASAFLEVGMTGFEPATSTSRTAPPKPAKQLETPYFVDFIAWNRHFKTIHEFSMFFDAFSEEW
jgi:hypothetical protein